MTYDYYGNSRVDIAPLLPKRINSILELGCGSGGTLKWIQREWQPERCVAIEFHSTAAGLARSSGITIVEKDIESMSADDWAGLGKFDVVLALDVLEHLVDPWRAVRAVSSVIEPAGTFVASIPNVRSHGVLFPLAFRGEWSYGESGLLDRTHLRFFTKRSALALVETAFTVRNVTRTVIQGAFSRCRHARHA